MHLHRCTRHRCQGPAPAVPRYASARYAYSASAPTIVPAARDVNKLKYLPFASMNPRAALFVAMGLAALAPGCGSSSSGASIDQTPRVTPPPSDRDQDSGSAPVALDGSVRIVVGSPLCNATFASVCYPDNWAATNAKSCGLVPDGGAFNFSGGNDNAQLACHIERADHDGGIGPTGTPTGRQTQPRSG